METQGKRSPITGKEGSEIEVKVAADWTRNYRSRNPTGTISEFFGNEILQRLLQQPDCLGIRMYYSNSQPLNGWQRFIVSIANFLIRVVADAEGEKHLILTGTTREGTDQIPGYKPEAITANATEAKLFKTNVAAPAVAHNTILVEQSMPCPGGAGCPQNVLTGGAR